MLDLQVTYRLSSTGWHMKNVSCDVEVLHEKTNVSILAGSVIRMFESFLTTPVFRAGLKKYLTNKYCAVKVF